MLERGIGQDENEGGLDFQEKNQGTLTWTRDTGQAKSADAHDDQAAM